MIWRRLESGKDCRRQAKCEIRFLIKMFIEKWAQYAFGPLKMQKSGLKKDCEGCFSGRVDLPSKAPEEGRLSGPARLRTTLSCPPTAELRAPPKAPINEKSHLFEVTLSFTRSTGLEPVASTVTGWRDNQLHQDPKCNMKLQYLFLFVNNAGKKTSNSLPSVHSPWKSAYLSI